MCNHPDKKDDQVLPAVRYLLRHFLLQSHSFPFPESGYTVPQIYSALLYNLILLQADFLFRLYFLYCYPHPLLLQYRYLHWKDARHSTIHNRCRLPDHFPFQIWKAYSNSLLCLLYNSNYKKFVLEFLSTDFLILPDGRSRYTMPLFFQKPYLLLLPHPHPGYPHPAYRYPVHPYPLYSHCFPLSSTSTARLLK